MVCKGSHLQRPNFVMDSKPTTSHRRRSVVRDKDFLERFGEVCAFVMLIILILTLIDILKAR